MAKGRFTRYAEAFGAEVGIFFNKAIEATLKSGLKVAIMSTKHDSSLAAYHWMVVPKGGQFRPGNRSVAQFKDLRGVAPVGERGAKGANKKAVRDAVMRREIHSAITRAVKAKIPVFALYNDTPRFTDDVDPEDPDAQSYRQNARIDTALRDAYQFMNTKFDSYIIRGQMRKVPFSGAKRFPDNF